MKTLNAIMMTMCLVATSNAMAQYWGREANNYQGQRNFRYYPDDGVMAKKIAEEIVQSGTAKARDPFAKETIRDIEAAVDRFYNHQKPVYKGGVFPDHHRMSGKMALPAAVLVGAGALGGAVYAKESKQVCDEGQSGRCERLQQSAQPNSRVGSAGGAQ